MSNIEKQKELTQKDLALGRIELIFEKQPDFAEALTDLLGHITNTYGEKYQSDAQQLNLIDCRNFLTNSADAKFANLHSAAKYIQRYGTTGQEKSNMEVDLKKAAHYILFELTRRRNLKPIKG